MSVNTVRKPSASANVSRAHSPLGSPINGPTPRNLSPSAAVNIYGNAGGAKSYNSGWQMWGNAQPAGRTAGGSDIQPSQTDANYRATYPDNWPITRPTGSWDDEVAQQSEFDRSLGRAPVFGGSKTENLSLGTRNGQHVSAPYEGSTRSDAAPRFPSIPSPNHIFRDTYSNQDAISRSVSGSSDVSQLSLALRGMAVEDDAQVQLPKVSPTASHHPAPPHFPQPPMYGAYPQAEFSSYYLAPTREGYGEYQYGYSQPDRSPLNPALLPGLYPAVAAPQYGHLPNHLDLHRGHSGYVYEYPGARAPSQYYYPPQPVLFPPTGASPMMTAQMPVPVSEHKKRHAQPMLYNTMRSPASPRVQGYGAKLDYQSAMAGIMPRPGAGFGTNPGHAFPHTGQSKRGGGSGTNDSGAAHRSPVLEEFRGNKARGWELKDIIGYAVEFCGDQHGSRFIQQKLETAMPEEKQTLFDEIIPAHGLQLVQDVFGNYVIQKLFEFGTSSQKTTLLGIIEGHILSLTTQMYGCRVVQKAIEFSTAEQQTLIIRELEPHVMKCVKDSNGNHVVQRLIEKVSPDRLGFVNNFRGSVFDLSTHPYGCRVLQRAFEHLPDDITRPLMDELLKYSMTLTQDQFGNYVIQYIIEHGKAEDRNQVISKLHGHMLHLARHKFASNVCEKALVCADADDRRRLVEEMMASTSDMGNPIIAMMRDQYANYVLQRSVIVADTDQRAILISKIKPHLLNMRRFTGAYTKHLTSIERLIEKYPSPQSPDNANKQSML